MPIRSWLTCAAVVMMAVLPVLGCRSAGRLEPAPTRQTLQLVRHVGGTHHRMLVADGVWLQTFGARLLVLEPQSNRLLHALDLAPPGSGGPAVDMCRADNRLYIVLEDDELVTVDVSSLRAPQLHQRVSARELGVVPRRVSCVDGEVYVSGDGGVLRLSDSSLYLSARGDVGHVAPSSDGPVACIGRRAYRLTGEYVGSASDLHPAPDSLASRIRNPLVFVRQIEQGALVGVMNGDIREINAETATVVVPGRVRSVRSLRDWIWIVLDDQVVAYELVGERLEIRTRVNVLGVRDVGWIDDNHLAMAGSFGRAVYRRYRDGSGPGDTFLHVHREPGRLERAQTDGRRILAGSEAEGAWMYPVGSSRAELSELPVTNLPLPPREAATLTHQARIVEDGQAVEIVTAGSTERHMEPNDAVVHCVAAVDGAIWIGHSRGITAFRPAEGDAPATVDRLRFEGPVRYLFPLTAGQGAAFVSEHGGFGIARFVSEPTTRP